MSHKNVLLKIIQETELDIIDRLLAIEYQNYCLLIKDAVQTAVRCFTRIDLFHSGIPLNVTEAFKSHCRLEIESKVPHTLALFETSENPIIKKGLDQWGICGVGIVIKHSDTYPGFDEKPFIVYVARFDVDSDPVRVILPHAPTMSSMVDSLANYNTLHTAYGHLCTKL